MPEDHDRLTRRIREIALRFCGDYPNIDACDPMECLWAIESTFEGTELGNMDCHRMIRDMRQAMGLTESQLADYWKAQYADYQAAAQRQGAP